MQQHEDIDDLGVGRITLLDRVAALSYRPPPPPCDNMRSHFHELHCGHIVRTELKTTCGLNCTSPMAGIYGSLEVLELPLICPLCLKDEVARLQRTEKMQLEQEMGDDDIIDDLTWELYWVERLPGLTRQCTARGRICEEGDYAYLIGEDKDEKTASNMLREMKLGKRSKRGRARSRSPLRSMSRPQHYRSRSLQRRCDGKIDAKEVSRGQQLEALVKPLYESATSSAFNQSSVLSYGGTREAVEATARARSRSPSQGMTQPGRYRSRSALARRGEMSQALLNSDADDRGGGDLALGPALVSVVESQGTSPWIQTRGKRVDDVLPLQTACPNMDVTPQQGTFTMVLPIRPKHRGVYDRKYNCDWDMY